MLSLASSCLSLLTSLLALSRHLLFAPGLMRCLYTINEIVKSRFGEAKEFEFEFKGGELIILGNQGVGSEFEVEGWEINKFGKSSCGETKVFEF